MVGLGSLKHSLCPSSLSKILPNMKAEGFNLVKSYETSIIYLSIIDG